jgi:two-component system response regulator MtrA
MASRMETNAGQKTVLVVDEIPSLIRMLALELRMHGFRVAGCEAGEATFAAIEETQPDVILLDVLLPGVGGVEIMRELKRRYGTPIVLMTTGNQDADRALAYELGAADYIVKPFDPYELGQRVAAVAGGSKPEENILRAGELTIDLSRHFARRQGRVISLSTNEWAILLGLAAESGKTVSAQELIEHAWGGVPGIDKALVQPLIDRLRDALEETPANPSFILGDMEVGFRLNAP